MIYNDQHALRIGNKLSCPGMTTYNAYVICTSPRSGSTLLCKLLARTGIAGKPESYFHRPSISAWCNGLGLEPDHACQEREQLAMVFRAAIAKGSLDTGMFGLRLQRHSFDFFLQKLAVLYPGLASDEERFHAAFGRTAFIYLKRDRKIEQAVSYVKAEQTGLWHKAPDGRELERLAPPSQPVFDANRIRASVDQFTAYDRDWQCWFKTENITPLCLTYELLAGNPSAALQSILSHLELDPAAADGVRPDVAKLADSVNLSWVEQFTAEQDRADILPDDNV